MLPRLLALSLLLAWPASAQGDTGGAAAASDAAETAGKDMSVEKAAQLRARAQRLEEAGKTGPAAALRRRADRLEKQKARGKSGERRPRETGEPDEKGGKKPADEKKKG